MGSLVPGWDANEEVANKVHELEEEEKALDISTEERKGYFAKLELRKSMKKTGEQSVVEDSSPVASQPRPILARTSASSVSVAASKSLERSSPTAWGASRKSLGRSSTDWSQELECLRGPGKVQPSLMKQGSADLAHDSAWWARLPSGGLNERPDLEEAGRRRSHESFKPQFNVTKTSLFTSEGGAPPRVGA